MFVEGYTFTFILKDKLYILSTSERHFSINSGVHAREVGSYFFSYMSYRSKNIILFTYCKDLYSRNPCVLYVLYSCFYHMTSIQLWITLMFLINDKLDFFKGTSKTQNTNGTILTSADINTGQWCIVNLHLSLDMSALSTNYITFSTFWELSRFLYNWLLRHK